MKPAMLPRDEHETNELSHIDSEIELLARETDLPRDLVARVYTRERAKLEGNARIKTYVPVLTHRHVKELLLEQHRA
jgi:Protein of unknown function (DUF3562)